MTRTFAFAALVSALVTACDSPGRETPQAVLQCSNGVLDGSESAVDCGGTCARCAEGAAGRVPADCASGACEGAVCAAAPACDDGRMNGGETGLDCGGTCAGCPAGGGCAGPDDCLGGVCEDGTCAEALTCSDAALSPGETDIDCGGACSPCATDKNCAVPGDCLSHVCTFGVCRDPSCDDELLNQDESDVDCGGRCPDCAVGADCGAAGDCASGRCEGGACASCSDGRQSGAESGVDCGGPCGACGDGKACGGPDDCASGRCEGGLCASCDDGRRSGSEAGVDCGGLYCAGCDDGAACMDNRDCASDSCVGGRCRSCDDGQKNGAETGVDCGAAACGVPCPDGQGCGGNNDCSSGTCASGRCVSCDDGQKNGDETGVDCGGARCDACTLGAACDDSDDCAQGICDGGTCCTPNACGLSCGAPPNDDCDGVDDDCNGVTDDGALGAEPLCANQAGVCAGARAVCNGGWQCPGIVFTLHDPAYQTVETRCDGRDNDCDGQTDEGLKNACGGCGPLGPDVCDGQDNDCDGMTDEVAGCAACDATPTVVALAPKTGTSFGGPPLPGTLVAKDAATVWSAHVEPVGELSRLYVTRFVGATQATMTALNDRVLEPTIDAVDGHVGVVGRASFSPFARRYHPVDATGAAPDGGPIEIITTPSTAAVAQRLFMREVDTAYYVEADAALAREWSGPGMPEFPEDDPWYNSDSASAAGTRAFYYDPLDLTSRAIRVTGAGLVDTSVDDGTTVTIGPAPSSVELSLAQGGTVALFDVDATTGAVRAWYRREAGVWQVGAAAFPAGLRFLGGDVVTGGPIVVVARDASDHLVGAVMPRGGSAWSTVVFPGVSGIGTAATTEVAVDDAGRAHVLAELAGATPARAYLMVCPTCPGGQCEGASGPVVIDEVLYDTVGADNDVFVELRGTPGQSLDGWSLEGVAGDTGSVYRTIALSGSIPASGLYLVASANGNATLRGQAQLIANVDFQNGPDGVALRDPDGARIDALAYAAAGASILPIGEGSPALAPAAGQSLGRQGGVDTGDNAADFTARTPTPGVAN